MSEPFVVAFSTTSSLEEAKRIAHAMVEQRLAACVNIIPGITSVYAWKESIEEDTEFLLIMKTRSELVESMRAALVGLHSYEVAEFVVLDVASISAPYARWIEESTGERPPITTA